MKAALLDVNVLIALLDVDHIHHKRALAWLASEARAGWASCPMTQNGCIRVMSQSGYPNRISTAAVAERLRAATSHPQHTFWTDDFSLLDAEVVRLDKVLGPRQVTDVYLLALAVKNDGTFVTFDGQVPLAAVVGATRKDLVVL